MFLIWKNQPVLTRAAVTPAGACHYGEIVCEKLVNCDNHCATICLVFCSMEQQETYAASSCCLYFYNTATCALYTLDLFLLFCLLCCMPSDKKGQSHSSLFILFLEGQEHGKSIEHPKTCILLPRVFKLSACCVLYLFNMSVNPCSFGGSWVPLGEPKRAAGAQGASSGPCLARSSARQQGSHRWGARDKPGSGSDTTLPYLQHSSHQGEKLCSRGVFKPKSM